MSVRIRIMAGIAPACVLLAVSAGCGGQAMGNIPTIDPVSQVQTMDAMLTSTAGSLLPSSANTPLVAAFSTLAMTPSRTQWLEPTPTATAIESSIVLPGWIPEGARTRLGRGVINHLALSPDGISLAVGTATGLFLFQMDAFEEIWSVPTSESIDRVSFSADGQTLITVSSRVVRGRPSTSVDLVAVGLWNVSDGSLRKTIQVDGRSQDRMKLAFSPDGNTLAVGSEFDSRVTLWDLSRGRVEYTLSDDSFDQIESLAFTSDNKTLVSASSSGDIVYWDTETRDRIRGFEIQQRLDSMAVSPDGKMLAVSNGEGVDIWNGATGDRLRSLQGLQGWINTIAFSPDGKMLAAGDALGNAIQWDPASGHCLRTIRDLGGSVHSIVYSPGGNKIAVGLRNAIHAWDSATGGHPQTLEDPFSDWLSARYSISGGELALWTRGKVLWWTSSTEEISRERGIPMDAVISPDSRMAAYAVSASEIAIIDLEYDKILNTLQKPDYLTELKSCDGTTPCLAFAPDGTMVATLHIVSKEYLVDIWDLKTGRILRTQKGNLWGPTSLLYIEFSLDGKWLALGSWDWEYGISGEVIEAGSGQIKNEYGYRGQFFFAFSPDGSQFAVGSDRIEKDNEEWTTGICLFNIGETKALRCFDALEQGVVSIDMSFDGTMLAYGTESGNLYVVNTADGTLRYALEGHNRWIRNLSFSPDGNTLASVSEDGTVILWDVDQ